MASKASASLLRRILRMRVAPMFAVGVFVLKGHEFLQLVPIEPGQHKVVNLPRVQLGTQVGTVRVCVRLVQILFMTTPLVVLYVLASWVTALRPLYCVMLRATLERLGPGFVKLGQWAVTREDIAPPDVRRELGRLHNRVTPHSAKYTRQVVEKELGCKIDEMFINFEDAPCGSGSIAQVHRGQLRSNGDDVVVKVAHPKVRERIALDCACLRFVAKLLNPFLPLIDLTEVMAQFEENLSVQVDLRFEAQNLVRFRDNFSHMPYGVQFPVPYSEYATEKILVESYMPGQPVADTLASGQLSAESGRLLAGVGTDLFMQMLVTDNFFHADLHPGNMVIGHYANGKPYIGLLDVGITHTLSENERSNVFRFMQGIQLRDPDVCAQAVLGMSDKGQPFCNADQLRYDVRHLFQDLMPVPEAPSKVHSLLRKFGWIAKKEPGQITEVFSGLFDVIRKNHVQLDAAYASLLFSTMMLEGVCNDMDPDFDLTRATLPWLLASPMRRLFGLEKRVAYVA